MINQMRQRLRENYNVGAIVIIFFIRNQISQNISVKLKRPRILTIYKHKGKYTPAEVIRP